MNRNPHESKKCVTVGPAHGPTTYRRAIIVALAQQAIVLLLAALILDGGTLLRWFSGGLLVSWVVSLAVMFHRRDQPTRFGVAVVSYGFWLAIVFILLLVTLVDLPAVGR